MTLYYKKTNLVANTANTDQILIQLGEEDIVDYCDDMDELIQDIQDIEEAERDFRAGRCTSLKDWIEEQMNHYKDILDRMDD